jgi:hypothetical protein
MYREVVVVHFKVLSQHRLKGVRKTTDLQNSLFSSRDRDVSVFIIENILIMGVMLKVWFLMVRWYSY